MTDIMTMAHWRRVRRTWFNLTFTRWLWSITSKVLNIETKSLKLFNFRFKQPSLSLFCCLVLLVRISFTRIITHLILFLACQVDDPNLDNVMADYQKQGISSSTHSELTDQKISRSEPQLYARTLRSEDYSHFSCNNNQITPSSIQCVQKVCLVMLHKNWKFF